MKDTARIHVTLTRPMRVALEDLAYRNATSVAVEARRLLRGSLERTINTAAVQMRLRAEGYQYDAGDEQVAIDQDVAADEQRAGS